MSDIVINGITYPEPKRVAFPGSDGKPVIFDLPEDADKGLNPISERPVQNKVIHAAITAEAAARAAADEEIHQHLTSPYNFKGSLASASALPAATADNKNDTYYLIAEKYRVTSNGTAWEQSSMEESQYTDELAEVKSALSGQVGIKSIAFNVKNAITNNVGIGNVVDITGEASNYTNSAVVECSVGDVLYITGYGWGQQRLWSFLDSDNKLLSISAGGLQATDLQLIAPPNTAKAVFNVQPNHDFALYKVSTKLDSTTPRQMGNSSSDLSVAFSRKLSNIHNDIIFVALIKDWDDLPDPLNGGVFECKRQSSGYAIQTFTVNFNGSRYNRIVSTSGSVYRDWCPCQLTYIPNPSLLETDFNKKLANISQNYIFNASPASWDDTPTGEAGVFENWKYSSNYNVQTFKLIARPATFTRFVHSTTHEIYSDWVIEDQQTTKKILCVGDSVAKGWRNNGKGFVGGLGMPYSNEAVDGATLSNIRDDVKTSIPNQLINSTYDNPDIVISNGGINDFLFDSPIGTVPTSPAYNDELASNLNLGTALGGLEMLLYTMIKKYPKAQRFFVLSHKIRHWENVQATPADGSRRYNYHELMESIRKTCELYNCYVIDIFNKSIINTGYSQYVAETAYPNNEPFAYVDHDEIHPLAYGYEQGYLPLVREAIKIGTRK